VAIHVSAHTAAAMTRSAVFSDAFGKPVFLRQQFVDRAARRHQSAPSHARRCRNQLGMATARNALFTAWTMVASDSCNASSTSLELKLKLRGTLKLRPRVNFAVHREVSRAVSIIRSAVDCDQRKTVVAAHVGNDGLLRRNGHLHGQIRRKPRSSDQTFSSAYRITTIRRFFSGAGAPVAAAIVFNQEHSEPAQAAVTNSTTLSLGRHGTQISTRGDGCRAFSWAREMQRIFSQQL
jgi:hypothetical protein